MKDNKTMCYKHKLTRYSYNESIRMEERIKTNIILLDNQHNSRESYIIDFEANRGKRVRREWNISHIQQKAEKYSV